MMHRRTRRAALALLALALPLRAQTVATVEVRPARDTVAVGDSVPLVATARTAAGVAVARVAVAWGSVTPATAVARPLTGALVWAIAREPGDAIIAATATARGVTATARVVVVPRAHPLLPAPAEALPTLPLPGVDLTMPAPTGRTIAVPAGGDLQAALTAAQPGDVVELAAGAVFTGAFVLPAKPAGGWIVVRPAADVALPPPGTRLDPTAGAALPRLVAPSVAPALRTAPGASGWRLVGLELTAAPTVTTSYGLVVLGDGSATTRAEIPSRIVLDRVWVHGHATLNVSRCVALNAALAAVVDSYLSDCHAKGSEAQGIAGWAGPGPFTLTNNTVEASGIGILFGGADPRVPGLIPSDITVTRNHLVKPLAWKGVWTAKNAFELKNAQRVLVEGNVLENTWVDAQNGFIVLFQALSQNNSAPWTTVRDVTVRYNLVRNAPAGVNLFSRVAYDYAGTKALLPAQPSARLLFAHNVFDKVGEPGSGNGRLFQLGGDLEDVTIAHTTGASYAAALTLVPGLNQGPTARLVVRDNLWGRGAYGLTGDVVGEGLVALERYAPDGVVRGNVVYGTTAGAVPATRYPPGNAYPASDAALAAALAGAPTTDGRAPGADVEAVRRATAGVVRP